MAKRLLTLLSGLALILAAHASEPQNLPDPATAPVLGSSYNAFCRWIGREGKPAEKPGMGLEWDFARVMIINAWFKDDQLQAALYSTSSAIPENVIWQLLKQHSGGATWEEMQRPANLPSDYPQRGFRCTSNGSFEAFLSEGRVLMVYEKGFFSDAGTAASSGHKDPALGDDYSTYSWFYGEGKDQGQSIQFFLQGQYPTSIKVRFRNGKAEAVLFETSDPMFPELLKDYMTQYFRCPYTEIEPTDNGHVRHFVTADGGTMGAWFDGRNGYRLMMGTQEYFQRN